MGTTQFGIPSLKAIAGKHDIAAVVTRCDSCKGRGLLECPTPIKEVSREMGLKVFEPVSLSDPQFINDLKAINADLFFVAAFRILPPSVFKIPPKGTINLHGSLLPDYRGPAPINWAIINDEEKTGLTTFYIEETVDTGKIILTREIPIDPDETAVELSCRMRLEGAELALETLDLIESGNAPAIAQPIKCGKPAPKLFKQDGRIDWEKDARTIHNLVRGMNPFPGAFTDWCKGPLKIHRTRIVDEESAGNPGEIDSITPDGFVISCGKGKLLLLEIQPPGKKIMDGLSFTRGYRVEKGTCIFGKKLMEHK